jgi:hypothetical protein
MGDSNATSVIPPPPRPTPASFDEQRSTQSPLALVIWRHGTVQTPPCHNCRSARRVDPFGACVADVNGVLGGGGCATCVYIRSGSRCSLRVARMYCIYIVRPFFPLFLSPIFPFLLSICLPTCLSLTGLERA